MCVHLSGSSWIEFIVVYFVGEDLCAELGDCAYTVEVKLSSLEMFSSPNFYNFLSLGYH